MIFAIVAGVGVVILALIGRAKSNTSASGGSKNDNGATGTGSTGSATSVDTNGDGSIDGSELKNRIAFGGSTSEVKTPVKAPISRGKPPSAPTNRTVEAVPSTAIKPASPLPPVGTSIVPLVRKTFTMR